MKRRSGRGIVSLVGAGPGDPGLVTVRGLSLLKQADVVVVDALVNQSLLKRLRARLIYVGKRGPGAPHGSSLSLPQPVINQLLVRLGKQGRRVVRLKGGDPFVFGRGSEEIDALARAGVSYEVVPGVSSAIAAPAVAGIPITDRRWASQVTFVTGHGQAESRGADPLSPKIDWKRIPSNGTLVVLMGVASWRNIQRRLLASGWPASKAVVAIESATNADQRVIRSTLKRAGEDFERRRLVSPAVIVVGDVARLGSQAKIVVVTRPAGQSRELSALLRAAGARVIDAPAIRVRALGAAVRLKRTSYDWLVFLSANAVRTFEPGPAKFSKVMAVGAETKRVAESRGWRVVPLPGHFTSRGVLTALGEVRGKFIMIPRVQSAPKDLPRALRSRGASVEEVGTYETAPARFSAAVKRKILSGVDAVTFTSASTVRGFIDNFTSAQRERIFRTADAVSMGPQTSAALRDAGVRRIRQAINATIPDLLEAIQP